MITVRHLGPENLRLCVVRANSITLSNPPEGFDARLEKMLLSRRHGLSPEEDAWRQSVRDILRHGRYKPTGRGKPASEYLLRAAAEQTFPRINAAVDICNYISLLSLLPVSVWDTDKAASQQYVVRLGAAAESYVFNNAGQTIGVEDLVVGASVEGADEVGIPRVNPVKDSMETKTSDATRNVAAIVYARVDDGPTGSLDSICRLFRDLLAACAAEAEAAVLCHRDTVKI